MPADGPSHETGKAFAERQPREISPMEEKLVLIIEEEEHTLTAYSNFLQREEISMMSAGTIDAARDLLKRKKIDLLIVNLSKEDNVQLSHIKKLQRDYPQLPFILTSAVTEIQYNKDFQKLRLPFLAKPIDIYKLRRAVQSVFPNLITQSPTQGD